MGVGAAVKEELRLRVCRLVCPLCVCMCVCVSGGLRAVLVAMRLEGRGAWTLASPHGEGSAGGLRDVGSDGKQLR